MNKAIVYVSVAFLNIFSVSLINAQSCLPGGITFTSQSQINNFATNYPGCSQILGSVTINGSGITNLNGLSQITSVNGSLNISRCNATNLSGLQNLTSIGGSLIFNVPPTNQYFNYLPNLNSVAALSNLTTIGGSLNLVYLPSLTSLNGLQSLTAVGADIQVTIVPITSLSVFQNLNHVTGNLTISSTQVTNFSGLDNITTIGGSLNFSGNNALTSIAALSNLTTIGGTLTLGTNTSLTNLNGLGSVTAFQSLYLYNTGLMTLSPLNIPATIPVDLFIWNESALLAYTGWQGLTAVGGDLWLLSDQGNLSKFSNLTSVGGDVNILNLITITDLTGLNNLTAITGDLNIGQNPQIQSLNGLSNSLSIGGSLNIYLNDVLSQCAAQAVCNYIAAPAGTTVIQYNLPDCNSVEQVEADCNDDPPTCPAMISPTPGSTGNGVNSNITWEDVTNLPGAGYLLTIGTTPGGGDLLNNFNVGNVLTYDPPFTFPYNTTIYVKISPYNLNGTNTTCIEQSFTTVNVCPTDLFISSQSEANQFSIDYPLCIDIPGAVYVAYGIDITDLTPLNQIETIGAELYIGYNDNLAVINGFSNLTEVNGDFFIEGNNVLNSVNGFDNLNTITGDLYVWYNPMLSDCVANGICQYVDNPTGTITISDNATGCNAVTEVENACLAALPIELAYWYAQPQKTAVLLRFGTITESDVTNFSIEHSTDGIHFESVGQLNVPAEGAISRDYTFAHNNPIRGLNYYRLQSTYQHGEAAYSSIISARLNPETLLVSPNPGLGKFIIGGFLPENAQMQVIDAQGRVCRRERLDKHVVNLSDCPDGLYWLQIWDETGVEIGQARLLKTD